MAYLLKGLYKDGYEEPIVIWSAALDEEISLIMKINQNLVSYELISNVISESACKEFDKEQVRTKNTLPKTFRSNQETIREEKYGGVLWEIK